MKYSAILLLSCVLSCPFVKAKSGFALYSDVMQILPFVMMAYSYSIDDVQGVKEQAIGAGGTLLSMFAIKQSFAYIARDNPAKARISQRPSPYDKHFDGFPSGHTAFVFSSVGFAQKRYGWKFSLPLGIIATSVGFSRIYADKHDALQVLSGALLGFGISYLCASKYPLSAWVDSAHDGSVSYHLGYLMRF
ncbi:phosphatase PAP2 family protein [Helicobacter jaachi]|uniref:Phosphatase PAP2 family protein n=1 Tax=Helicobacter jaachi TaxID=1677920 RepID=A0A4U8T957_9HELI|nr:phosphatase PAP2 family protein [Helicobacter jaachi]TLD96163.1 phosphatase PAP2 family protein [Helicobacter jaachi]